MTNNTTIKDLLYQAISMNSAVELFQYIIIGLIFSIQLNIFKKGLQKNSNDSSGELIKIGVFGTFLGIVIGLFVFNPNNITDSIPEFLGGMKIAFLTSVTGMFFSLVLDKKISKTVNNNAGIGDLILAVNDGNHLLSEKMDKMNNSVGLLGKSISGENEGSLLSQLTLLRSNLNDRFGDLTNEFKAFAKLQAENNTKALVEAIREVIGDFNAKINEQFGENFKELNAAVGDLVGWQENYKDVVEKSFSQFELAVASMDKSKEMLELIHEQYQDNLTINTDVKDTLQQLKLEHDDLEIKMQAFNELAKEAKTAFPTIQDNIDHLTQGFSDKVHESISTVTEAYQNQTDSTSKIISEMNDSTHSVLDTMKDSVKISNDAIKETAEQMKDSVDESMSSISDRIVKGFNDSMVNMEQLQQKLADNMEGTIMQIDDALRQELEKSLQSLGSQLATLSKRFVDDYADLTNRMQQVVNMAES